MRFNKIRLSNFRQYRDMCFNFPKTTVCDAHIVLAQNGIGKSVLLNAINWCLYSDEPHTSGGIDTLHPTANRLPICNLSALDDAKEQGEGFCDVCVDIEAEDAGIRYTFTRKVKVDVNTRQQSGRDVFRVKKTDLTGESVFFEDEAGQAVVDSFLPKTIREYFFFDGERLLNYFSPEESRVSMVRDSIFEIAGVNVIARTDEHLQTTLSEIRRELSKANPNLKAKERVYNDILANIRSKEGEIRDLEEQIAISDKKIGELEKLINNSEEGYSANLRFDENEQHIAEYERQLEAEKKKLIRFVRRYLVAIYLYRTNADAAQYIREREENEAIQPNVDIGLIQESLDDHMCHVCKREITPVLETELRRLLEKYKANESSGVLGAMKRDVQAALNIEGFEPELSVIFDEQKRLEMRIDSLRKENDGLLSKIGRTFDAAAIEDWMRQKQRHLELIQSNNRKLGAYEEALNNLRRAERDAKRDYDDAVDADRALGYTKKKKDFVEKAESIIAGLQARIVDDVKRKMQDETMRLFEELIWKKNTYDHIELDKNFRLKLYHKRDGASCLNSCSAAEMELLALAFTIALHHVSGYDHLLFIDTPVGRVSDVNRENFARKLLDVSKEKQIILAFTPSEYSDEISNVMSKSVVSSYTELKMTEDTTTEV